MSAFVPSSSRAPGSSGFCEGGCRSAMVIDRFRVARGRLVKCMVDRGKRQRRGAPREDDAGCAAQQCPATLVWPHLHRVAHRASRRQSRATLSASGRKRSSFHVGARAFSSSSCNGCKFLVKDRSLLSTHPHNHPLLVTARTDCDGPLSS